MECCDVLLINPPYPRRHGGGILPPIGLCYLAASLRRAGAHPTILDLAAEFPDYDFRDTAPPIEMLRFVLRSFGQNQLVLIGIGPLVTASLRPTRDIVKACRTESRATIVAGGPLCSAPGFSQVAEKYLSIDAYVAGVEKEADHILNLLSIN